jgi:hypothetical protein
MIPCITKEQDKVNWNNLVQGSQFRRRNQPKASKRRKTKAIHSTATVHGAFFYTVLDFMYFHTLLRNLNLASPKKLVKP